MEFIDSLKQKASTNKKRIVLPEGLEERTLQAANTILQEGFADVILIGNPTEMKAKASELGLTNIDNAEIVDPENHAKMDAYADMMVEIRKTKGLTKEEALKLIKDPLYLSVMMIV